MTQRNYVGGPPRYTKTELHRMYQKAAKVKKQRELEETKKKITRDLWEREMRAPPEYGDILIDSGCFTDYTDENGTEIWGLAHNQDTIALMQLLFEKKGSGNVMWADKVTRLADAPIEVQKREIKKFLQERSIFAIEPTDPCPNCFKYVLGPFRVFAGDTWEEEFRKMKVKDNEILKTN